VTAERQRFTLYCYICHYYRRDGRNPLSRRFAIRLRYVTPPNLPSINFVISSVRYYICSADRIFGGGRAFGGGAFGGGCASVVAAYSVVAEVFGSGRVSWWPRIRGGGRRQGIRQGGLCISGVLLPLDFFFYEYQSMHTCIWFTQHFFIFCKLYKDYGIFFSSSNLNHRQLLITCSS
jgi:hypothetical protein